MSVTAVKNLTEKPKNEFVFLSVSIRTIGHMIKQTIAVCFVINNLLLCQADNG